MKNLIKISFLAMCLVVALPAFAFAQTARPATMSFNPSSGSVVASPNFTVDVIIDTNGSERTSGADAVVKFDATKIQYISAARPATNDFYGGTSHTGSFIIYDVNASTGTVEIGHSVMPGTAASAYPTGTGSIATLTFKPLVAVGQTVSLNLDFVLGATTDSNVISSTGTDILGGVTGATLTIASAPVVTTPTITSISPTSGDQNLAQSVTITGTNLGTQGTNSKVYIGQELTTVTSWSDTQIIVQIPTQPQLTASGTWQIKVHRDDGQEATFIGYTYTVAGSPTPTPTPLPDNGPEMLPYFGLAMSAFGMAGLTYTQLTARKKKTEIEPESSDSNSNLAI